MDFSDNNYICLSLLDAKTAESIWIGVEYNT